MTALSIMRLVPSPPGKIVGGSVKLEGRDLLQLDESEMRDIRGNDISMIFQEPMTSLNPVLTIGHQIAEAVRLHQDLSKERHRREGDRDAASGQDPGSRRSGRGNTRTNCRAGCGSAR